MSARSAGGLVARTVALAHPPDLRVEAGAGGLLWRAEDGGIAGHGEALRVELPGGLADRRCVSQVAEVLASIPCVDEVGAPGCGPLAVGALPFDPASPGHLVVPRRVVGRSGSLAWATTVGPAGPDGLPLPPPESPRRREGGPTARGPLSPDRFELVSSMPHDEWKETVAEAVVALRRGDLDKVVIARRVDIAANRPFVVPEVLERLTALYPSCTVFSVGGFVGASPELLVRRTGREVESHPLAGTVARSGDAHGDEELVSGMMSSTKARHEHRAVVDAIASSLGPSCSELQVPELPSVVSLRNVSHLGTLIRGRLRNGPLPAPTALELVALLHPTPAVGGTPTDAAVAYLQKVEGFERGCYAGPVGWVDARGDGAWVLGIRSAEIEGRRARIYAGNGIVASSDPEEELAETQLKLQALLAALVRP